ncbi:MAG: EAL domain-containing protein [Thiotrichaceae bacterium]|nr:EAL domain-containing protein [Thiotrichaceae bacterium]
MIQNDIIRLIVIEESANDAEVILNRLRKARFPIRPKHIEDDEDLQEALSQQEWDLIITVPRIGDPDIYELTATTVCEIVKTAKQDIPIIVITDKLDGKIIAEVLAAGAKQVVPDSPETCLQIVVGLELDNLAERRKRRQLEQLYKEGQKHNKMLLETSRDAIAYVHDGMHIHANPSYLDMFGYKKLDDMEGVPIMDLVAMNDQANFKEFMRDFMADTKEEERTINLEGLKSNSKRFKFKMEVSHARYDSEPCIQVIIRDQSQSEELERQLKEVSRRDQLTGLFNRQHFFTLLEKALAKAMAEHVRSVLLYIMVDDFVAIRDRVGVGGADPLILNMGKLLKKVGDNGSVARFNDSAFTILIPDKDVKYAGALAQKICKAVESQVTEIGDQTVVATCSVGIALVLASSATPQGVLSDAHAACNEMQNKGGNGFNVYKAVVHKGSGDQVSKNNDVAKLIETAFDENRLSLRFQPIVSLHDDTQAIYEVFLRMQDANGENVPTADLFSAAEQANMVTDLDKWVLKESLAKIAEKEKQGEPTHLFIKLADQSIRDESVLLFIRKLLKTSKIPGERVIVEISESSAISQVKLAKAFMTSLKAMNCQSALEHFGTGLNYETTLRHLPVDYVKIDSSFTKGLGSTDNAENQKAIEDIVKKTHELGMKTIAEAVEDANSLTVLWSCEVDFAQGHYIQEPIDDLMFDFSDEE